jgi:two-component system, LytTR family, response regulator
VKHAVFVVDDEPLAVKRLVRMLAATGRVEVVGEATDPEAALARIAALPELGAVFLDISMPGIDGFELARRLPPRIMIVFTTAHDAHALRAFEVNAIDYLLKPIRDAELARALDKLDRLRALPPAEAERQLASALARIASTTPERIASRIGDKILFVELAQISHFYAEAKLTYAVTRERSYVVDPPIAELEERYGDGFFRIHRATLVRLSSIVELHAAGDGTRVRVGDGKTELLVARDRVRALKDRLGLA